MPIVLYWILVLPSAHAVPKNVMVLERSTNANQVVYEVDFARENPIRAFWIMKAEKGQIEPLTPYEDKKIYGTRLLERGEKMVKFSFQGLPELPVTVREEDGRILAYMPLVNEERVVKKMHLNLGGTFYPSVRSIELECEDGDDVSRVEMRPLSDGKWQERMITH